MAAITKTRPPLTTRVAIAASGRAAVPPPREPRAPSHAARRVTTALRAIDGRLTVVCPAS